MRIAVFVVLALLTGCAGPWYGQQMSAEQIAAAVKDKNASVSCWRVLGPGYSADVLIVNLDQGSIRDGGLTVADKCSSIEIKSMAPQKVPPTQPPKANP